MSLYERIFHMVTPTLLCVNKVKHKYVGLKVLCERIAHIDVYAHMYDDLVNRGALNGVLKCTLNKMVLEYAMSM